MISPLTSRLPSPDKEEKSKRENGKVKTTYAGIADTMSLSYRRKSMFGVLRKDIGEILKELCRRFGIELLKGHVMPDLVHKCLGIPHKYTMAQTIGRLKGKSAILIHQKYGRKRNFVGLHFWSRGYCVSTVGLDESMVLNYIRTPEEREQKEDQLN
jgi:putative transposase